MLYVTNDETYLKRPEYQCIQNNNHTINNHNYSTDYRNPGNPR